MLEAEYAGPSADGRIRQNNKNYSPYRVWNPRPPDTLPQIALGTRSLNRQRSGGEAYDPSAALLSVRNLPQMPALRDVLRILTSVQ
jgi:hypothetical protein